MSSIDQVFNPGLCSRRTGENACAPRETRGGLPVGRLCIRLRPGGGTPGGGPAGPALPHRGQHRRSPFRSFPGEVVSPRTGRLSFEVSGRLIEFPIQNGQLVKKGDLIGQLDTADFIAARDSAQASFDAAKINFERNEGLQQRGAVPMAVRGPCQTGAGHGRCRPAHRHPGSGGNPPAGTLRRPHRRPDRTRAAKRPRAGAGGHSGGYLHAGNRDQHPRARHDDRKPRPHGGRGPRTCSKRRWSSPRCRTSRSTSTSKPSAPAPIRFPGPSWFHSPSSRRRTRTSCPA